MRAPERQVMLERWVRLVAALRYRPGWAFKLEAEDRRTVPVGVYLHVRATVPDADGRVTGARAVTIADTATVDLTVTRTDEELLRFVYERVRRLEDHERLEWLRLLHGEETGDDDDDDLRPVWAPHVPDRQSLVGQVGVFAPHGLADVPRHLQEFPEPLPYEPRPSTPGSAWGL